jgi:perosamine synthetase
MDDGRAARISIPVYKPDLSGNELSYVAECIESTWISSKGRFVGEFEERFAQRTGCLHATSVSNGTVALHLALLALGLGPGDEVIVPTLTYIAPVNAVTYTGATAVFADSVADTWQVDPADVARRITPRTKAIIAVHLYGNLCDMDTLLALGARHGVPIIEDAAEALGSVWHRKRAGSMGAFSTFSFHGSKTITTGEGGMFVTNDDALHKKVLMLSSHGRAVSEKKHFWPHVVGFKYRLSNVQAAIGCAQRGACRQKTPDF